MSAKSKKIVRKLRRDEQYAEERWIEKGRTIQRRQAQWMKTTANRTA